MLSPAERDFISHPELPVSTEYIDVLQHRIMKKIKRTFDDLSVIGGSEFDRSSIESILVNRLKRYCNSQKQNNRD